MTLSASRKKGSASWTARRASRTSFQVTAIRLGRSAVTPVGTTRTGRPALRIKLPGSRARNGSRLARALLDDDEIGRPRLACDHIGLKAHVALQPTDLILELSARPLECIVESKMNVRMPLVQARRAPDIDLLSVRERQADVDLIETAGAVVFARCLHHDSTREATLEADNVLGNNCAQG